jgi:prevent-host-death family protein
MKTVTFTEFRNNASQIIDRVEKGETVRVLRHGKAVARIVPDQHEPSWKRPVKPLVIPGVSLSRLILEERWSGP